MLAQGRSSRASSTVQSASSKEQDMSVASDVLSVFGTLIRTAIQTTIQTIADIRNDQTVVDVRGLKFSMDEAETVADLNLLVDSLNIPSPTFTKERSKKLASTYLKDCNEALLLLVHQEIDSAPVQSTVPVTPAVGLNITERV